MRVGYVKFSEIPSLTRLFHEALSDDFGYFPHQIARQVRRENSLPRMIVSHLKPGRVLAVVAESGRVVGYAIASAEDPRRSQLYWLYVRPSHRGQGLSRQLMEFAHQELKTKGSQVVQLVTHDFADYYRSYGYNLVGRYPIHGVEMHLMELRLK